MKQCDIMYPTTKKDNWSILTKKKDNIVFSEFDSICISYVFTKGFVINWTFLMVRMHTIDYKLYYRDIKIYKMFRIFTYMFAGENLKTSKSKL